MERHEDLYPSRHHAKRRSNTSSALPSWTIMGYAKRRSRQRQEEIATHPIIQQAASQDLRSVFLVYPSAPRTLFLRACATTHIYSFASFNVQHGKRIRTWMLPLGGTVQRRTLKPHFRTVSPFGLSAFSFTDMTHFGRNAEL